MPHGNEQHTDWRRVLSGSAAGPTAAPRWAPPAEVEAAPLAVTGSDPLVALVDQWLPLHAAWAKAQRDYNRRLVILGKLGLPVEPRVRLAVYRSEQDDQGAEITFGYSEVEINQFYDKNRRWQAARDELLEQFRQISAKVERTKKRLGVAEAEARVDATEDAVAQLERQITDMAPVSLAEVIAKLRFALALNWENESPMGGPTPGDQAPGVQAVAEAITFLEPHARGGAT